MILPSNNTKGLFHLNDGDATLYQLYDYLNNHLSSGGGFSAFETFANADSSPSVASGSGVYIADNSSNTTISNFDDPTDGQFILVYFATSKTTIDHNGSTMWGERNRDYTYNAGDIAGFIYNGTLWYQATKIINSPNIMTLGDGDTTPSILGSNTTVFRTANTGATSITRFDSLEVGQLYTVFVEDNNTTFVHAIGALVMQGSVSYAASDGDVLTFMTRDGSVLHEISRKTV